MIGDDAEQLRLASHEHAARAAVDHQPCGIAYLRPQARRQRPARASARPRAGGWGRRRPTSGTDAPRAGRAASGRKRRPGGARAGAARRRLGSGRRRCLRRPGLRTPAAGPRPSTVPEELPSPSRSSTRPDRPGLLRPATRGLTAPGSLLVRREDDRSGPGALRNTSHAARSLELGRVQAMEQLVATQELGDVLSRWAGRCDHSPPTLRAPAGGVRSSRVRQASPAHPC